MGKEEEEEGLRSVTASDVARQISSWAQVLCCEWRTPVLSEISTSHSAELPAATTTASY